MCKEYGNLQVHSTLLEQCAEGLLKRGKGFSLPIQNTKDSTKLVYDILGRSLGRVGNGQQTELQPFD